MKQALEAPTTRQVTEDVSVPKRRLTIAEARRKAFGDSEKAQEAQIAYAEEESKRAYDYRVHE